MLITHEVTTCHDCLLVQSCMIDGCEGCAVADIPNTRLKQNFYDTEPPEDCPLRHADVVIKLKEG